MSLVALKTNFMVYKNVRVEKGIDSVPKIDLPQWFYSVAVITSGSDPSAFVEVYPSPGDPGSIPGRT